MSLTKVSYSMIQGAPANVLDYGADPTGVTECSAAFQAAIAAASHVYVPKGTYRVNPINLKDNLIISGDGEASKLLANTTTGILCSPAIGLGAATTYVEILDLGFDGLNSKGIYQADPLAYSSYFYVRDCYFTKALAECIILNLIASRVESSNFGYDPGPSGTTHRHIYIRGQDAVGANQVFISDNHFQTAIGTESFRAEKGTGLILADNIWEGNFAQTEGTIVCLGIQSCEIYGNYFEADTGPQIFVFGKKDGYDANLVQIHNNIIQATTAFGNQQVIYISNEPDLRVDYFYNFGGQGIPLIKDFANRTGYATSVMRDFYSNFFTDLSLIYRVGKSVMNKDWIINGSMEANSGWVASGTPVSQSQSSAQAHAGTYSWQFTVNGQFEGIRNDTFFQDPICAGQFYTLNFWVYPTTHTTMGVSVGSFGTSQYNLNVEVTGLTLNIWNNVVLNFEALFDQGNPVVIFNSGTQTTGTWYIDDVFFKQILNPQTGTAYANNAAALAAGVPINSAFTISNVLNRVFYA